MNFGEALECLKEGRRITTRGWGHAYIQLYEPDDTDVVSMSYIFMGLESGVRVVWVPTHTELLDEGWKIYDDFGVSDL